MRHPDFSTLTLILAATFFVAGCKDVQTESITAATSQNTLEKISLSDLEIKAESGDAQAQVELGARYANGDGVQANDSEAIKWWAKAADQNNTEAMYFLGFAYKYGIVSGAPWERKFEIDRKKAFKLFEQGAKLGDNNCQFELGEMYLNDSTVKKNIPMAIGFLEKAAIQNNTSALISLATLYSDNKAVPADYARSFDYLSKAAKLGDSDAQSIVGYRYYTGTGVPKDYAKAAEFYKSAAMQGNAAAQNNLGHLYLNGLGVSKDKLIAYAWFNVAATQGNKEAERNRGRTELTLDPEDLNRAQALSSNWQKGQIISNAESSTEPNSRHQKLTKYRTGTAFYVSKSGHALTNYHVIDGCSEIRAQGLNTPLELVSNDRVNDIALLKSNSAMKKVASISGSSTRLRQGEDIAVFGFPLNAVLSSGGNLTPGVVSATTGFGNNTNQIQITAPIQPGSSGSPVLNLKGEVIGVVAMKLSDAKMSKATGSIGQNVNFAISAQTIRDFLDGNKVPYSSGTVNLFPKSVSDLGDEARQWTTVLECWK
jgi:uncharacterized protein